MKNLKTNQKLRFMGALKWYRVIAGLLLIAGFFIAFPGCDRNNGLHDDTNNPNAADRSDNCTYGTDHADLTDVVYQHINNYQASYSPYIYLPQHLQGPFQQKFDSLQNIVAGMDLPATLTYFQSQGAITQKVKTYLQSLESAAFTAAQSIANGADQTNYLTTFTTQVKNDATLSCTDKEVMLNIAATMEGFLRFGAESNFFAKGAGMQGGTQDRGCFWQWVGCFFKTLILDTITGTITGALVGMTIGDSAGVPDGNGNLIISGTLIGPGAAIGAVIGAIVGVIQGIIRANDCCPDGVDCKLPTGISLVFAGCTPSATYMPWGMGPDLASLVWGNSGGTPVAAVTFAPHSLLITQTNPAVPVETSYTSVCADGSSVPFGAPNGVFTRNLSELIPVVSPFVLYGSNQAIPGNTYNYYVDGIAASDGRHTFTFSVTNNGTIISQTATTVRVVWDEMGEGETGVLTVTARNTCSGGQSQTKTRTVTTTL